MTVEDDYLRLLDAEIARHRRQNAQVCRRRAKWRAFWRGLVDGVTLRFLWH